MSHGTAPAALALWLRAIAASLRLRRSAGESRRKFAVRIGRWLRRGHAQTGWLRLIEQHEALRHAACADARLYDRWQQPYLSAAIDASMRRRIIEAHYRFIHARFPYRIRDKLLRGHDVPLASLRTGRDEAIHLHLRKPNAGDTGELALYLLNANREALAHASFTLGGVEGLLIGAIEGPWSYLGERAIADFRRQTGVAPREVLIALLRSLADSHSLERIRLVAVASQVTTLRTRDGDMFSLSQGGNPAELGCYELARHGLGAPNDFIREACAAFERAFDSDVQGMAGWRRPSREAPPQTTETTLEGVLARA